MVKLITLNISVAISVRSDVEIRMLKFHLMTRRRRLRLSILYKIIQMKLKF